MGRHLLVRGLFAVVACAALSATGTARAWALQELPRAARGGETADRAAAGSYGPGSQRWVAEYRAPGTEGFDEAHSIAVSPDGRTVFVTGSSLGATSGYDYATIAYNAATGARLWVRRYNGPANGDDHAVQVAVSPTGGTVFVTGSSTRAGAGAAFGYATIAYNAATGARLWVQRYNGAGADAEASSLAVSPTGRTVFVTGLSSAANSVFGYATVAYNAATGARRWVKRYNGPGRGDNRAVPVVIAVSPAGGTVFVTGSSPGATSGYDYATVAYNAATGARRWVKRYNGPGNGDDQPSSVVVSPAGGTVYVTGFSAAVASHVDYTTIAYNATTGARRWVKRYNGPAGGDDEAAAAGVSPGAGTVYVTGFSDGTPGTSACATIAYNPTTGAQQWTRRYSLPGTGEDACFAAAVSPANGTVFVTGETVGTTPGAQYLTIAYSG